MEIQKPKHISEFKEGDLITRIENYSLVPILNDIFGKPTNERIISTETSGIGHPFIFKGIFNGRIFLESAQESEYPSYKKGEIVTGFDYTRYQYGWAQYINPDEILGKKQEEKSFGNEDIKEMLNKQIWN